MKLSWQQIPSTIITEMLCEDFDGVVLDTEHGCYGNEALYNCIQIITAKNKVCLVRLTEINKTLAQVAIMFGVMLMPVGLAIHLISMEVNKENNTHS